jgi:uncharacterized protein
MQNLDPRVRWVWMLGWAIPVVVLAAATVGMVVGGVPVGPYVAGGLAVVMAVSGLVVPFLAYRNWWYQLRADELVMRYGVVTKVERWVPRLRIQHVDVIGGPVERLLGLRQLVIYTAGTREADVKVPGLTQAVAEDLRGDLLEWTQVSEVVARAAFAGEAAGDDDSSRDGPAAPPATEPGSDDPGAA